MAPLLKKRRAASGQGIPTIMLNHLPWAAKTLVRHGVPATLLHFMAGLGDELLCSCVLRELAARGRSRGVWFMTRHPELFQHLPERPVLLNDDNRYTALVRRLGRPVVHLRYTRKDPRTDQDAKPVAHILKTMLVAAGVQGEVRLRPWLSLTEAETAPWTPFQNAIVLQSSTQAARYPILLKDYPAGPFNELCSALARLGRPLVQIGARQDPPLAGTKDLRGRTSPREAAALLSKARLFVGLEGGLMHLSRAVNCPAVIIYGGRQQPEETGYLSNINLSSRPPCSPCWGWTRCDHGLECMTRISPAEIFLAVEKQLSKQREEMNDELASIGQEEAGRIQAYLHRLAQA